MGSGQLIPNYVLSVNYWLTLTITPNNLKGFAKVFFSFINVFTYSPDHLTTQCILHNVSFKYTMDTILYLFTLSLFGKNNVVIVVAMMLGNEYRHVFSRKKVVHFKKRLCFQTSKKFDETVRCLQ